MPIHLLNILETPPTFFNILLRLALSLFASLLAYLYPKHNPSVASFDIDPRTGFFPPKPLPFLGGLFAIWEAALNSARDNLSLGEDDSDHAVAKRPFGQLWRTRIDQVMLFCSAFFFNPILNFSLFF